LKGGRKALLAARERGHQVPKGVPPHWEGWGQDSNPQLLTEGAPCRGGGGDVSPLDGNFALWGGFEKRIVRRTR